MADQSNIRRKQTEIVQVRADEAQEGWALWCSTGSYGSVRGTWHTIRSPFDSGYIVTGDSATREVDPHSPVLVCRPVSADGLRELRQLVVDQIEASAGYGDISREYRQGLTGMGKGVIHAIDQMLAASAPPTTQDSGRPRG